MIDPRISFLTSVVDGGAEALTRAIGATRIRIRPAPEATSTSAGQVLAFQLATLAARLFDRVEIEGDEAAATRPGPPLPGGPFIPALRAHLARLRPSSPIEGDSGEVRVVVGRGDGPGDIFLGAAGWGARVSAAEPQPVAETGWPLGALAAGTLGAAEVFKLALRGRVRGAVSSPGYALSLLDYGPEVGEEAEPPDPPEIDAVLFGCGSIGCGFLQAALCVPRLRGRLVAVDNGRFEPKNVYKYSLVDADAAERRLSKAAWAREVAVAASHGRLDALAFVGTAEEYVASLPHDYGIPLAISAVDTFEARMEIQDALPMRAVNAGIDGTSVEVSAHGFGAGPCLACLGMESALETWDAKPIADRIGLDPARVHGLIRRNADLTPEDVAEMRGRGVLPGADLASLDRFIGQPLLSFWNARAAYGEARVGGGAGPAIRVSTAFVSAFAGVLLLAEALKSSTPGLDRFRVDNSYRQDLLGVPAGGVFRHAREARGWCLCHSAYRLRLHREKYSRNRSIS